REPFLRVKGGKSKNAKRAIPLKSPEVKAMLEMRIAADDSKWLFPGKDGNAFLATSLDHLHSKLRAKLSLSDEFVIHSMRHTFLTRLGESGQVSNFDLMKIAGHYSITVSEKYIHPTTEGMERPMERFELSRQRDKSDSASQENDRNSLQNPLQHDIDSLSSVSDELLIQ